MDVVTVAVAIVGAVGGIGGIAALIRVFTVDKKQVGVDAAKANAEIKSLGIDDQSDIITNLRLEITRLSERLDAQDTRITKLESRNEDLEHENAGLRTALMMVNRWASRAWQLLTSEQKLLTGPPPEVDALLTVERN